jgi:hypothetical protein
VDVKRPVVAEMRIAGEEQAMAEQRDWGCSVPLDFSENR